jgi:hypothetical protein
MATRKETADALKQMVVMHWVKRGFACFVEQGVNRRGVLRADVVAMSLSGHVIITEVKSCRADFVNDKKWPQYRPYCDQFYMAWPKDFGVDLPTGTGLLLPNSKGWLTAKRPAANVRMEGAIRRMLITRLAWRAGTFSKRNTRRTRVFLE